jgi:UDP-N-acetylglucosamine acyltransferase
MIHPSAIVEPGALLAEDVEVGPFAYIGAQVKIGAKCRIGHHATVEGRTAMGAGNVLFPYAYVGGKTQDLKYSGGSPGLRIGQGNTFREFCTVHTATGADGVTVVGDNNYFLAYTHIAHDCIVGNHVIISNNGTLAGHVRLGDHVVIGGLTAVHQFCQIGEYAMLGGCAKVVQDVPPFMIADGVPSTVRTINKVGLERNGFSSEDIQRVRQAYKIIFRQGLNHGQAIEGLRNHEASASPIFQRLIAFIESSERGFA